MSADGRHDGPSTVSAALASSGIDVLLRDGSPAHIRPIRPDDKQRLQEGLRQLSPRSRYMRFHTAMSHLTEEQLRYLTEIDYRDHMAWVAVNPDDPDEGMGVARYVRLTDEPTVAEAAITVIDRYQGNGLGTILLEILTASAIRNGIRTFRNYVLAENRPMLEIFEQMGGVKISEGAGVYRVDVELADAAEGVEGAEEIKRVEAASHLRHILRSAARRALPPFRWVFPWTAEGVEHGRSTLKSLGRDGDGEPNDDSPAEPDQAADAPPE
jgi:GNAT superfamily N-acetyltransferase